MKQEKLNQAREEEEKGDEKIVQAKETLEELQLLRTEVKTLHDKLERRQEDIVVKAQSARRAYGKIENIMSLKLREDEKIFFNICLECRSFEELKDNLIKTFNRIENDSYPRGHRYVNIDDPVFYKYCKSIWRSLEEENERNYDF